MPEARRQEDPSQDGGSKALDIQEVQGLRRQAVKEPAKDIICHMEEDGKPQASSPIGYIAQKEPQEEAIAPLVEI